jgi:hypothetical protein
MKVTICAAFAACLLPLSARAQGTPTQGPKESLHVYLLIGQSNMAGRAAMGPGDEAPIPRALLLDGKDQWEPASNPLNRHSTVRKALGMQKMGPGYGFALTMLEKQPGVTLGLVVNARGGSSIAEWKKGTKYYNEAIRRALEAQKTGTLKGILWHQGESDMGAPAGYLDALKQLIQDLRTDLGHKDLPFVCGEIHKKGKINDQLMRVGKEVAHAACVSAVGLTTQDGIHFDTASSKELGKRYAEAMLGLVK